MQEDTKGNLKDFCLQLEDEQPANAAKQTQIVKKINNCGGLHGHDAYLYIA